MKYIRHVGPLVYGMWIVWGCPEAGHAQQVGVGTATPHSSAVMEINAAKGLLIPRLTTRQRNHIDSPAHGLAIYNVDKGCVEIYDSLSALWRCNNYYDRPQNFCRGFNYIDSVGQPGNTEINGIVAGPDGNLYVVGRAGKEGLVAGADSMGRLQWVATLAEPGKVVAFNDVALDSNHHLIVAGYSESSADADVVVMQMDRNGQALWTRFFTADTVGGRGIAVAVDKTNRIVVAADYYRMVTGGFGGPQGAEMGILIVRMKTDGDTVWTRLLKGDASGSVLMGAADVAADTAGRIAIVGTYESSPPWGYVAMLDSVGDTLWTRAMSAAPGAEPMAFEAVTVDPQLNVYVAGYSITYMPNLQGVILKLTPDGDTLWYRYVTDGSLDSVDYNVRALHWTPDGYLLAAGQGDLIGDANLLLMKLAPDAQLVWGGLHGSMGLQEGTGVAYLPASQTAYIAGKSKALGNMLLPTVTHGWNGVLIRVDGIRGRSCCFAGQTFSLPRILGLGWTHAGIVTPRAVAVRSGGEVRFVPLRTVRSCP